ncbi:MAG: hypothetical protein ACK58T_49560, partial [Phycisphaerae bacterium]
MAHVRIIDQTMRDGQQSLWGMQMRAGMALPVTPLIDYVTALPLALSGTVLGIGLIHAFNVGWLPLTGTASIIVLAYVIRRLPFGLRSASSTLYN